MTDGVPVAALHGLLTLLRVQGIGPDVLAWVEPLIAPVTAARHMRRFKLDVSLDLTPDPTPRMSLNDSGEPTAFRQRLRAAAPHLGLDHAWLDAWLSLSDAGDGQTTLGIKWLSSGLRSTLYFEELAAHSDPLGCRSAVREFLGLTPSGADGPGQLGALGVDLVEGVPVALKEYRAVDLDADSLELPPALRAFAEAIPTHPRTGLRRALLAERLDRGGASLGRKLLWMTEARSAEEALAAWRHAAGLARAFGGPMGPNLARVLRLVRGWRWSPSCYVYPDLVSLDVDPAGAPLRMILYISLK